eukprot:1142355-Pelagomonas_calceolata.AAC.1
MPCLHAIQVASLETTIKLLHNQQQQQQQQQQQPFTSSGAAPHNPGGHISVACGSSSSPECAGADVHLLNSTSTANSDASNGRGCNAG